MLLKLLYDVDVVIDLYCLFEVVMYVYMSDIVWLEVELFVCYFGVEVLLFVEDLGGYVFDDVYYLLWLWLCVYLLDGMLMVVGIVVVMVECWG